MRTPYSVALLNLQKENREKSGNCSMHGSLQQFFFLCCVTVCLGCSSVTSTTECWFSYRYHADMFVCSCHFLWQCWFSNRYHADMFVCSCHLTWQSAGSATGIMLTCLRAAVTSRDRVLVQLPVSCWHVCVYLVIDSCSSRKKWKALSSLRSWEC